MVLISPVEDCIIDSQHVSPNCSCSVERNRWAPHRKMFARKEYAFHTFERDQHKCRRSARNVLFSIGISLRWSPWCSEQWRNIVPDSKTTEICKGSFISIVSSRAFSTCWGDKSTFSDSNQSYTVSILPAAPGVVSSGLKGCYAWRVLSENAFVSLQALLSWLNSKISRARLFAFFRGPWMCVGIY